jgi:hypothetical protein
VIVDLVSPWLAATQSTDSMGATAAFRDRHVALLAGLRHARTPASGTFPLSEDRGILRAIAPRAADPATQQLLRQALGDATGLGADHVGDVVLVAGDGEGDGVEPLPHPNADVVLFLELLPEDDALVGALARAAATVTRWRSRDSQSVLSRVAAAAWDRWELVRTVTLREWLYTEGIAVHLAAALLPGRPPHQLFDLSPGAFARLRERERVLRALLAPDLDECGIGLTLRWLTPAAPAGPRTVGRTVIPSMAGRYLAWRMTAERVERVGLAAAIRDDA